MGGTLRHPSTMIILKSERDLEAMRPACAVAAKVLAEVTDFIQPGVTTAEVDEYAASLMKGFGAKSAFLGYRKYPCHTCISINDQVVHGLAGNRKLLFGDIVSVDVGVIYAGFIGDNARTVAVGGCNPAAQRLMDVTEKALYEGIAQAKPGRHVQDISRAIQRFVESNGYGVVREFVGHGVGRTMHEEQFRGWQEFAEVARRHDLGDRAHGQCRIAGGKNLERRLDSGDEGWFNIRSF